MAKKKTTPKATAGHPPVRVRMYRQGLGDCFLITFNVGQDERHMLIDCGTLGAVATETTMKQVAADIASTTTRGGKPTLEALVVTHGHKDHVSGFLSQDGVFGNFRVGQVWMGWTEDPTDALANSLGRAATGLRAAVAGALRLSAADEALRAKLQGVAEFEDLAADGLAMGDSIAEAMTRVRTIPGVRTVYHSPGGQVVELPSISGFRFYVLGPPRDGKKLGIMGEDGSDELYGLASAVRARAEGQCGAADTGAPFDLRFCYPLQKAGEFHPRYVAPDEAYRRVDGQWMGAAAELAAKLDRFRNNTSLALAIERIGDGRVLLFPADAQQGNWLSWHDAGMKWTVKGARGEEREVVAADLLQRTVFYKVGHHGSHNATVKALGLELMRKNKELTAFIPVDRAVALSKSPPNSWQMPAVALYRELLEACQGRVVRSDLGWADDAKLATRPAVEQQLAGIANKSEWEHWRAVQAGTTNVAIKPLYIDYRLD